MNKLDIIIEDKMADRFDKMMYLGFMILAILFNIM